jgi:DedD protein
MNDHNLDDLIIDTSSPKGGKAKSALTIIALLIVVMIAAIVLTKIILKDPDAQPAILEENDVEVVSPELTLQHAVKEDTKERSDLSVMIEEEIEAPKPPHKPAKAQSENSTAKVSEPIQQPALKNPPAAAPKPKTAKPTPKESHSIPKTVREKPAAKPVRHTKKPAAATGSFYIQVGSFSKAPAPDSRLITAIRKQGFKHRIFTVNGMKKVMVGPYRDRASADRAIVKIKDLINKSAFVVKR